MTAETRERLAHYYAQQVFYELKSALQDCESESENTSERIQGFLDTLTLSLVKHNVGETEIGASDNLKLIAYSQGDFELDGTKYKISEYIGYYADLIEQAKKNLRKYEKKYGRL